MRILELFEGSEKKKKLSHISNLVYLASIDGHLDKRELDIINKIAQKLRLTNEDMERIFFRPNSVKFVIPIDNKEKVKQLSELVMLMLSDSNIDDRELLFCRAVADKLGFKDIIIDEILRIIFEGSAKEEDPDLISYRISCLVK
ncbi:tellurite resistance TerB family protein [Faecalibacter bovis]|uniref:TerB family tellurite resistance protein n=1 Tax=Faecalibacter bovis TaxID=2898187 RepID=A0ABX7XAC1_9FLAO|nr:TerB family tellurite resistance protein [Faecalibacter bovis]QTV04844.1 TerB family tellurite resistance protein [Faecalibacter bovis]